jgi:hypothetical protein
VLILGEFVPALPETVALDSVKQPHGHGYTGRTYRIQVDFILRDERWLQSGVAALSVRPLDVKEGGSR